MNNPSRFKYNRVKVYSKKWKDLHEHALERRVVLYACDDLQLTRQLAGELLEEFKRQVNTGGTIEGTLYKLHNTLCKAQTHCVRACDAFA